MKIMTSVIIQVFFIHLLIISCNKKPVEPENNKPEIKSISASPNEVGMDEISNLIVVATDTEGDKLTYACVTNSGTGPLTWNISDDKTWITVTPTSGSTSSETDQVTVMIDRSGLSPGSYTGSVTIASNGGNATVSVSMMVSETPTLAVSTTSLDFGTGETSKALDITNSGTGSDLEFYLCDDGCEGV